MDKVKISLKRKVIELGKLFKNKYFLMGLVALVLGILFNQISSTYLENKYGATLPVLDDLFLDNLPFLNIAWLYDLLVILALLIFLIYAYRKERKKIPYFLIVFATFQLIRGIFIILTPVGSPNGIAPGLLPGVVFSQGFYPSGHVGSTFLGYLLAQGVYKKTLLVLSIFIMITLLLARGHYSLDIFSAIFFAYAIYSFGEKYFKKKFKFK